MKFAAVVSAFDWAWFFGTWGKAGVYRILDRLHWAGIEKVYLRMRQCQCYYPSRVDMPGIHFWTSENCVVEGSWGTKGHEWEWWPQAYNFAEFDPTPHFIERGHELGMEVYGWMEQAEAHGHGWESKFSHENPELLTLNREKEVVRGNLSWAYPDAIEFKLAVLREVLEYDLDGVALDFQKGGDHRTPRVDENGYWYGTYDPPAAEAFQEKTGRDPFAIPNSDPEWVQFRADYLSEFIRKARALQKRFYPDKDFGVMGIPKGKPLPAKTDSKPKKHSEYSRSMTTAAGPLEGNIEDHDTWTKEGLIDFLIVTALPPQTTPFTEEKYRGILQEAQSHIKGECRLRFWEVMWGADGDRVRQVVSAGREIAEKEGFEEVVFFQALSFQDCQMSRKFMVWDDLRGALKG